MELLPTEITTQILSKLPVRSVYVCRCVCKTWLNIIDDRQRFVPLHFTRSLEKEEATTLIFVPSGSRRPIYMVEVKKEQHIYQATQIDFCGPHYNTRYANSCNGLFCFSATPSYTDNDYHTYIHNPATRECVKLPSSFPCLDSMGIHFQRFNLYVNNLGFGFDHSSNKFKVLQVLYESRGIRHDAPVIAQVCTLGSSSWRKLDNFPRKRCFRSTPALVNGSLHWLSYDHILSFDLASENFGFLELPGIHLTLQRGFRPNINFRLVALGGCLSIADLSSDEVLALWIMEDYNVKESWIKLIIKKIFVENGVLFKNVLPICFRKSGDLLLLYGSTSLVSYEIKSGRYSPFEIEGLPAYQYDHLKGSHGYEVYPYVGNLMPIDTLCRMEA